VVTIDICIDIRREEGRQTPARAPLINSSTYLHTVRTF
jgi:hypothetical protein